jgi:macrolide transport system ATP-binding/permease protein
MKQLRALISRICGLFRHEQHEQDHAAEIESHLQLHIEDMLRSGMSGEQARREAILKLGGVESTKQAYREGSTVPFVETLLQDIRFSIRQLTKYPGFTCTVALMLALGMGASVAIYSFVDAALIKPLPYQDPQRLVSVSERAKVFPRSPMSYQDYLDWKKLNKVFSSMDAYTGNGYMLRTPSGAEMVIGARVSDGFFNTLGVTPMLGRGFRKGEDQPSAPNVVLMSYSTWQKRYGGRRDIIGQTVMLSGVANTVIGILPQDFAFALHGGAEFWATLHDLSSCEKRRSCHNLEGVGRLKDGISVSTALADMQSIAKQLELQYPGSNRDQGASVLPLSEAISGDIRPILLVLLSGAGLLLLIACVNVSSLLLIRSESRKREIAVRGALGASPARLVRQFITESLVLVVAGTVLGLAAAYLSTQALLRLVSKDMMVSMPFLQGLGMNARIFAFAGLVSVFAAVLFALTPIIRLSLGEMREGLTEASRGSAGRLWRRLGANLVVVELAIAVVLLVGAGLLGKSFYRLLHVDVGFEPDHMATLQVAIPELSYTKDEQVIAVEQRMLNRVSVLPGVRSAAVTSLLPVSCNCNTDWLRFVGKPFHGEHNEVNERDVSPGYFTTLQARLLSGRYFTDDDVATRTHVIIINQRLAKLYFPGEDPIGKKVGDGDLSPTSIRQIIGVVNDVKEGSLDSEIWPTEYFPFSQNPDTFFNLAVRTSQDEASVLRALSVAIHGIDPGIGTFGESTMTMHINESQTAYLHRSSAWLVGAFAALALLLGVVGLYGVIAYSVSQRTREIGVRMALGAQRGTVYQLVLGEAAWLAAAGIGLGLGCSLFAATLMRKLLFGTQSWDVQTLGAVTGVLALAAFMASFIPARRAATVDPMQALRSE